MSSKPAPRGTIVVGVDGSPTSDLAVDWAVKEATRRGLPLHIIHGMPYRDPMTQPGIGYVIDGLRDLAVGVRKDALSRVRRASPELAITWAQPAYGPVPALVDASEGADTVVVGARGMSRVPGTLMGSVAVQVAAHAHCPVVVVHEGRAPTLLQAPVVVGFDGSASSTDAIAYAFEQARARRVGLTVVHAWWMDFVEGASASAMWTIDWQIFAQEEQDLIAESLAAWQEKYPDVAVRRHSVRALPVEALVRQSENASLVVVGTRGRGGFGGLLLGSVSQGVMHRAPVPRGHRSRARGTPTRLGPPGDLRPASVLGSAVTRTPVIGHCGIAKIRTGAPARDNATSGRVCTDQLRSTARGLMVG